MSRQDGRLDELLAELTDDANAADPRLGLVDSVINTARWQLVVRRALGSALKVVDAAAEALRIGLGGSRR